MSRKESKKTPALIGAVALAAGLLGGGLAGWLGAGASVPNDCEQALEYAGDIEVHGKELAHTLDDIRSTRVGGVALKINNEADNLDRVERMFDRAVEDFSAAEESCLE